MNTNAQATDQRDPWDEGDLGRSLEHAVVADDVEIKNVDDALGLQLVSIRLQKRLIASLKLIAGHYGIGYQPMIRDLLNRFAASEIEQIMQQQIEEARKQAAGAGGEEGPVSEFLERERKRA